MAKKNAKTPCFRRFIYKPFVKICLVLYSNFWLMMSAATALPTELQALCKQLNVYVSFTKSVQSQFNPALLVTGQPLNRPLVGLLERPKMLPIFECKKLPKPPNGRRSRLSHNWKHLHNCIQIFGCKKFSLLPRFLVWRHH